MRIKWFGLGTALAAAVTFAVLAPRPAGSQETASAADYEQVDPNALSINLELAIKRIVRLADGSLGDIDATVQTFTVAGKTIDLITPTVSIDKRDHNFAAISTKEYGIVRLSQGSDHFTLLLYLTPSQKAAILALRSASVPPNAPPSPRWLSEVSKRRLIAYRAEHRAERGVIGKRQLFVMQTDGSKPRMLVNNPNNDYLTFRWSPDGNRIWYNVTTKDETITWSVNVDGSDVRKVVDGDWVDFSPDGKQIAYSKKHGSSQQIHVASIDGSNDKQLTFGSEGGGKPRWSPDGKWIAFDESMPISNSNYRWDIRVVSSNGGPVVHVAKDRSAVVMGWARDRANIIAHSQGKSTSVFLVDIVTGRSSYIGDQLEDMLFPTLSPAGDRIVYMSKATNGMWNVPMDIWTIRTDGTDRRRLVASEMANGNLSFSPDGKWVVFDVARNDTYEICVMGIDGQDFHQLTASDAETKTDPQWQPLLQPKAP